MKCLPFLLLISVILEPARPAGNLNAAPESLQQAQDHLSNQEVEQRRQAALGSLKINPADASANYQLGMIALAQKKPAEALPYFERIHVQRATDILPLTGILECQLLLKHRLAARQTVQELKRLLKLQDPRLFEVAADPASGRGPEKLLEKRGEQVWNCAALFWQLSEQSVGHGCGCRQQPTSVDIFKECPKSRAFDGAGLACNRKIKPAKKIP
jgi:hypothetical protein